MTIALPAGRRIAGWSCVAVGKVGSLLLLWMLLTSADTPSPDVDTGFSATLTRIGPMPLFAITVGILVIGLWLLLGSEGRPNTDGN